MLAASKTKRGRHLQGRRHRGRWTSRGSRSTCPARGAFDGTNQRGRHVLRHESQRVRTWTWRWSSPTRSSTWSSHRSPAQLPAGKNGSRWTSRSSGKQGGLDLEPDDAGRADRPVAGARLPSRASDVQAVGEEDVRGVATTHYTGIVDLRSLGTEQPEMKPIDRPARPSRAASAAFRSRSGSTTTASCAE